jgi:dienelactone hydrolase
VCNELAKGTVTAGAFAHPAFLKEHHFENIESMCIVPRHRGRRRTLIVWYFIEPLFLSCAEEDHTFDLPSRQRALAILRGGKKRYQYQLFSGVQHGFALRCDPKDPYQRKFQASVDCLKNMC